MNKLKVAIITLTIALTVVSCQDEPLKAGYVNDIVALIQQYQKKYVRKSYGTLAGQCFTELDYQAFKREERPLKITNELRGSRKFMEAVIALKAMPEEGRAKFIEECRKPLRKTWEQIGKITSEGTTTAGQHAELIIASAVADTVAELCELSHEEIFSVFKEHK